MGYKNRTNIVPGIWKDAYRFPLYPHTPDLQKNFGHVLADNIFKRRYTSFENFPTPASSRSLQLS